MQKVMAPPPSVPYAASQVAPTRLTYIISIGSCAIGAISVGCAIMNLSILAPSWWRLTTTIFSTPVSASVRSIWVSSTVTVMDQVLGALLAMILIFSGVMLLRGAPRAARFLRLFAVMRPIAAVLGAGAMVWLDFRSSVATGSAQLDSQVRWMLVRGYTYAVSLSLVSSLAVIILLRFRAARLRG